MIYLKPNERPYYDQAVNFLSKAHKACLGHEDRDVLGMSQGPFAGVNEALSLVLTLETLLVIKTRQLDDLQLKLIKINNDKETPSQRQG